MPRVPKEVSSFKSYAKIGDFVVVGKTIDEIDESNLRDRFKILYDNDVCWVEEDVKNIVILVFFLTFAEL